MNYSIVLLLVTAEIGSDASQKLAKKNILRGSHLQMEVGPTAELQYTSDMSTGGSATCSAQYQYNCLYNACKYATFPRVSWSVCNV
jgi:hypothetical protein